MFLKNLEIKLGKEVIFFEVRRQNVTGNKVMVFEIPRKRHS